MITGQLSKPLLSLRSNMSAAELRADDKAATPDSELNDEPLLLPSEATDREGTPNKLYGKPASAICPFSFRKLPDEVGFKQRWDESWRLPVVGQVSAVSDNKLSWSAVSKSVFGRFYCLACQQKLYYLYIWCVSCTFIVVGFLCILCQMTSWITGLFLVEMKCIFITLTEIWLLNNYKLIMLIMLITLLYIKSL